jgi:glycosyltransferase involved in cell wall biosynthesis
MNGHGRTPLVWIGLPVRRRSTFLAQAVESVLAQGLGAWRLFVSENGEPSAAIRAALEPYLGDPRIEHSASGLDLTVGGNHTRALAAASAPYACVLHDDDYWAPDFLERHVAFLDRHPAAGFSFSAFTFVDEAGRAIGERRHRLADGEHAPAAFVPVLLRENVVGPPAVVVMRRAAYEQVGPFFDDRFDFCDYELWTRLAVRYPVGYLRTPSCFVRKHRSSASAVVARGDESAVLHDHLETLARGQLALSGVAPSVWRSSRAQAHLRAALDAASEGEVRRVGRHLASAVRADPRAVIDLRASAAASVVAFPGSGRELWNRMRFAYQRRRVRSL